MFCKIFIIYEWHFSETLFNAFNYNTEISSLGHPSYFSLSQEPDTYNVVHTNSNKIVYTMVGEEPESPFANLLNSILAVYNWGSNLWILGIFGLLLLLINAFSDAEKESKYNTLLLQKELIYDYAFQDGSSLTSKINDFDHKFKDKLNIKYICFLDEPELTKSWDDKSNELGDRWLYAYGLHFKHEKSDEDNIEEVRFIWTREEQRYWS
ncbi:hypothetical protein F8M41_003841 [Gigaspora margarita]|uniref:Uncharacterized protein n=1 Tax=Gigaspora margarita TaxID=4874 RepID=A0A8H3XC25_GIGMA|nr:hypothetical protein F8M41_003841 [Gigaspora margarita]